MNLVVVSHKLCWPAPDAPVGYATDGGFPLQMHYLSEIFTKTTLIVPCEYDSKTIGLTPLTGNNISVLPLSTPSGSGIARKLALVLWLFKNGRTIWTSVKAADAVHAPIPGDIGTIGLICALLLRKRLFVRHCGNWLKPRTTAERVWKFGMETLAGKRNAMLATGGGAKPPSERNANIEWIFATSLTKEQLASLHRGRSALERPRILSACRQEERKGTDIVIRSLPRILESIPDAELHVAGDGSYLETLKSIASDCGVSDKVTFHGKLSQLEVLNLMRSCDLFCFPTSASEGFPKVVLEALATGMPVISTRVSVIPQLLSKGGGILLDSPDPESLAAVSTSILSDRERYAEMSLAARKTASRFTLENWRDRIAEFLSQSWGDGQPSRNMREKHIVGRL